MILRRNVAGQTFTIEDALISIVDGSAVTTGTINIQKDGTDAAGAGTLTHIRGGVFKYTPTQSETDCAIMGFTLTGTDAMSIGGSICTTVLNLQDANLGLTNLDAAISTVKSKTDNLPSDPADASDIASAFGTVNSTLSTLAGYIDTEVAAIKAKTDNLPDDPADASVIAGRFDSVDMAIADLPTNAELTAALASSDDATLAAIASLNNISSAGVTTAVVTALTTAAAESYRSTGSTGSPVQLLYEIIAHLGEHVISGTTKTTKRLDGSTTAKTYTLNDATTPTGITEAT